MAAALAIAGGGRAGVVEFRHTRERPPSKPQSVQARGSRFADRGAVALFFQTSRADIRDMRDPMERPWARGARPCPLCRRPAVERFRPFCSERCADIDLGRWLSGSYAIATDEGERPDAAEPEDD